MAYNSLPRTIWIPIVIIVLTTILVERVIPNDDYFGKEFVLYVKIATASENDTEHFLSFFFATKDATKTNVKLSEYGRNETEANETEILGKNYGEIEIPREKRESLFVLTFDHDAFVVVIYFKTKMESTRGVLLYPVTDTYKHFRLTHSEGRLIFITQDKELDLKEKYSPHKFMFGEWYVNWGNVYPSTNLSEVEFSAGGYKSICYVYIKLKHEKELVLGHHLHSATIHHVDYQTFPIYTLEGTSADESKRAQPICFVEGNQQDFSHVITFDVPPTFKTFCGSKCSTRYFSKTTCYSKGNNNAFLPLLPVTDSPISYIYFPHFSPDLYVTIFTKSPKTDDIQVDGLHLSESGLKSISTKLITTLADAQGVTATFVTLELHENLQVHVIRTTSDKKIDFKVCVHNNLIVNNSNMALIFDKQMGDHANPTTPDAGRGNTFQCDAPIESIPGDTIDNDCDGNIDEEVENGLDDDGDGQIDEDLMGEPSVDGGWSEWSEWICKVKSCSNNTKSEGFLGKSRECNKPPAQLGGKRCPGEPIFTSKTRCTGKGICPLDCPNGKYGWGCSGVCPIGCSNNTCNKIYGICESCIPGYLWTWRCSSECPIRTYGLNCKERCPNECPSFCEYTNGKCIVAIAHHKYISYTHALWKYIVFPILAALMLLTCCILAVLLCIYKCIGLLCRKSKHKDNEQLDEAPSKELDEAPSKELDEAPSKELDKNPNEQLNEDGKSNENNEQKM